MIKQELDPFFSDQALVICGVFLQPHDFLSGAFPEEHLQKSLFATKLVITTICVRSYDCEHLFL